jgi:Tol biopolymer transport system component
MRPCIGTLALWLALALAGGSLCDRLQAQVTQRVSLSSTGIAANAESYPALIAAGGRYVCFQTSATNVVTGDTNGVFDVYLRDRRVGATERVSVGGGGAQGNGASYGGWLSADGRLVAFTSQASNLVPGDTNGATDVFVRDRFSGTTAIVSINSVGEEGNSSSAGGQITADGRYVLFYSASTNLSPLVLPGQLYVHDRQSGITELASVGMNGAVPNQESALGGISADGRFVVFVSQANNLVPADTNGDFDVFVHDRQAGTTDRIDVSSTGEQANSSFGFQVSASISRDGRYVAFVHGASNLVPNDNNGVADVFVHDRQTGNTERASVDSSGLEGNGESVNAWVSDQGLHIFFASMATNLVSGDTNGGYDIFVHNRPSGMTERISVSSSGQEANAGTGGFLCISEDGRFVAFMSGSSNLVPGDTNGIEDTFLFDRFGGTHFTSACDPGVAGVLACPCSNAPSGPARGCDNSSGTGGAILSASGGTYLSSDSLMFTTTGERPTAFSVVSQWASSNPSGAVFGMGIRCTSGTLKRLYTKSAISGSITAPDFGLGDSQVSVRSAALGDPILAGDSRWYFIYYRDSIVLGGCPVTSTFNCTQTGQVTWSP